MTTELKLCVDCAVCTNHHDMGRANIHRTPTLSDEFHWCTRSAPDVVDGGPTVTCREMRDRSSTSTLEPGCGYAATLFVPRQNEQVPPATDQQ